MFALSAAGGMILSPADVCKTPAGPSLVPVLYPNMVSLSQGMPVAMKVLICGSPAVHKNTVYMPSSGDEPGVAGGVASSLIKGEVKITQMSAKVKIEGNPAVRLSMASLHNNNNSTGLVTTPSQTKVIVNS